MVRLIGFFLLIISSSTFAQSDKFSISDIKRIASGTEDEFLEKDSRITNYDDLDVLLLSGQQFVPFEVDGRQFQALRLPNGKLAPAYFENNKPYPGCIDKEYKVHKGFYDESIQGVKCRIDHADMLIIKNPKITNEVNDTKSSNELVAQENPGPIKKDTLALKNKTPNNPKESDTQNTDSVKKMKPGKIKKASTAKKTTTTSETAFSKTGQNNSTGSAEKPKQKHQVIEEVAITGIYIPPSRTNSGDTTSTFKLDSGSNIKFGIKKGTWLKVELKRAVTSEDFGEIEVVLLETVLGKHRNLPAGTKIFCNKSFNSGTGKLSIQASNGLLIEDETEFLIQGFAYDMTEQAGLPGTIIRNRTEETAAAIDQGLMASLGNAANQLPGISNPIGAGIETATNSLVDREQSFVEQMPESVIKVNPQKFLIQISDSI